MKREPKTARVFQDVSADSASPHEKVRLRTFEYPEKFRLFEKLDGTHPWMEAVPDGCVLYPVRELKGGRVTYFNFKLAKEMGLIPENQSEVLSRDLENVILKTFSLRIINEYDQKNKRQFEFVKPKKYMATRYLQLQHNDKLGRTSGDGRSIWNGVVTHNGKTWDISSRGTGVTCLAPGVVQAGKPLKSGGTSHGYGCGMAEIDELYGSALMSEIFHLQGVGTERMLAIVDIGKGSGIGVRAHQNLLRPAHFFSYLKQGDYKNLRRAVNFFIKRQVENKTWDISLSATSRYMQMCEYIATAFATLAARLDVDYIFVWLDWDGDNILADGSIIDYGSVRQFGLRHDQYRYDDVERFSTNLNEQKLKARQIVQTFIQLSNYLMTGKRKTAESFNRHPLLTKFDEVFEKKRNEFLLERIGFDNSCVQKLMTRYRRQFESFDKEFKYFERYKTSKPAEELADGVNRPAIFNMRDLLREMPKWLGSSHGNPIDSAILFDLMISNGATREDKKMTSIQAERIQALQHFYIEMLDSVRGRRSRVRFLKEIAARAALLNRSDRITGNSITVVVDEIVGNIKKGLAKGEVQRVMDAFIESQSPRGPRIPPSHPRSKALMKTLLQVVETHREDI